MRPNDDFIDQIVSLHNQYRRDPASCLAAQKKLSDLPSLARPWHREFWREPPDQSELPFTLGQLGDLRRDPLTDNIAALNTDILLLDISEALTKPDQAPDTSQTNTFMMTCIMVIKISYTDITTIVTALRNYAIGEVDPILQ